MEICVSRSIYKKALKKRKADFCNSNWESLNTAASPKKRLFWHSINTIRADKNPALMISCYIIGEQWVWHFIGIYFPTFSSDHSTYFF